MRLLWSASLGITAACLAGTAMIAQEIRRPSELEMAQALTGPMTLRLGRRQSSPGCGLDCAEFIYAEGDIRRDAATALMVLSSRLKKPLPVYLHSPGGNLEGGMELGTALRRSEMATAVARLRPLSCDQPGVCTDADRRAGITVFADRPEPGICNSACVYTFAGGLSRHLPAGSSLGVHQFFVVRSDDKSRRPLTSYTREDFIHLQKTVASVAAYLVDKGISIEVLSLAAEVDSSTVRMLTAREARDLKLATANATPFAPANTYARLPEMSAPTPYPLPAPRTAALPAQTTGSVPATSAIVATSTTWPVLEREGKPMAIASMPVESRRYGHVGYELAIGCAIQPGRYAAAFREIIPSRPGMIQDAMVVVGSPHRGEKLSPSGPLSRETALMADRNGVLELEVTSLATSGYPMRLELPGTGLKSALDTLDRQCRT